MRYLLIFVLVLFSSFFSIGSYAQDTTNLGDLLIRFCNDPEIAKAGWSKDLKINTIPNQEEDICIYLVNGGKTPVKIELGFVDGTITNDAEQRKACEPEGSKQQFGQYVTIKEKIIEVPANTTIETHASLKFGDDASGMIYGCATAKIVDDTKKEGMFEVVSRRANFIDVSVKWQLRSSVEIVNQATPAWWILHNKDKRFFLLSNPSTKERFSKIVVKNDGNVAQYVSIQTTYTWLWKKTTEETISKKILPKQENEFILPITNQPLREWPLQAEAVVSYTPAVEEWVDTTGLKDTAEQIVITTNALFIPWKLLFVVLWALLILLILPVLFKKKTKKKLENALEEIQEEVLPTKKVGRRKRETTK